MEAFGKKWYNGHGGKLSKKIQKKSSFVTALWGLIFYPNEAKIAGRRSPVTAIVFCETRCIIKGTVHSAFNGFATKNRGFPRSQLSVSVRQKKRP